MAEDRMEISDLKLFLRYSLPCADTLVKRGWVERDIVELELENAAITGSIPNIDVRDIFTVAFARCSLVAKQMGKDSIDKDVIRKYFWEKHDEAIAEQHKQMGDFDKVECRITHGTVKSVSPLIVEVDGNEKTCQNQYRLDISEGDHVVIHYSRLVEKISDSQFNEFENRAKTASAAEIKNEKEEEPEKKEVTEGPQQPEEVQDPKEPEKKEVTEQVKQPESEKSELKPGGESEPVMPAKPRFTMNRNEAIGTLLAILTAVVSGVAIFANKIFITGLDPALFTAVRALIVGLIFLLFSFASGAFRPRSVRIPWGWLFLVGVIGGGLAFLLFFSGLQMTTSGRAAFLHKTLPLWVAALAAGFLKERITRKQVIAMALMFAGTFMILGASVPASELWSNPLIGDFLVVIATIFWAIENVVARRLLREGESNFIVSFGRMFFGALFLFGVLGLTGNIGQLALLNASQITNLLISSGLLLMYVFFYYWSLRYINVSKAATILLAAPVITVLLGYTYIGEPVTALQLGGSAAILVGGVLISKVRSEFQTGV